MEETNSIEQWRTLASSELPEDREVAARALRAHVQDESGSTTLIDLLGDADWRVRRAAVETFLEAQEVQTIPMVLTALYEEENAGKRNAALDVLSRFGRSIIPYLEPHISADQSDVRMFLIQILGDLRDSTYLPFINEALRDENPNVVSAAIVALGRIGHRDSVPQLLQFLEGHDLWLKTQAIEALGEMQEPKTIPNLLALHGIPYCRKAIIKALGKFHDPQSYRALTEFLVYQGRLDSDALDALVQLYYTPQPSRLRVEVQQTIRDHCRKHMKTDSIAALLEAYHAHSIEEKKNILEVLGWSAADSGIPLMLQELHNEAVEQSAARALIHCGQNAAAAAMRRLSQAMGEEEMLMLLNILNELSATIETKALTTFLKHENAEIQCSAIAAAHPGVRMV